MRGHSPNITSKIEDVLVFIKGHYPAMKAKDVRDYLKAHLAAFNIQESQVPSVRAIQVRLNKPENVSRVERIQADPLNRLWSVGIGMKHGISAAIVPVLMKISRIEHARDELTYDLTVRKAAWVEYLYPALDEVIRRRRPKLKSEQRAWLAYCIAEQYAKLEELQRTSQGESDSERPELDTTDLDLRFLIEEDVSNKSVGDAGSFIQFPEMMRLVSSLFESGRVAELDKHPLTRNELGNLFYTASQEDIDRLNKQLLKNTQDLEQPSQ
jgi:hypothetical protein